MNSMEANPKMSSTETLETIETRRSIRRYRSDPIPQEDLDRILEAGRQAPSAGNRQPWRFVLVADPALRAEVARACNGQTWMADAAYILAGVGLPTAHPRWYAVDTGIALQNMVLAAWSLGYGTCWIGAFNEAEVKRLLKVPADVPVIALTPLGVPAQSPAAKGRKPLAELFSREEYSVPLE
jgi:nitroreductase